MMRKKSFFGFVFAFMFAIMNLQAVTVHAATIHVVEEWNDLNGTDAPIWTDFQNGDTISLEKLKQWNENRVKVEIPSEIHALTIHGLPEVTYEYIGFTAVSYVAITLDNFNGHNNISGGAGDLLTFSSPTGNQLVLKGNNNVVGNIYGNFEVLGDGSFKQSYSNRPSSDGNWGNVTFNHTGSFESVRITGDVTVLNSGTVKIGGGRSNENTVSYGVGGNVVCKAGNTTIMGSQGRHLTDGESAVKGNVVLYNDAALTLIGGDGVESLGNGGNGAGNGLIGNLFLYDSSSAVVTGGTGTAGIGGTGVVGNVYCHENSVITCRGGNGATMGDSTFYGDGGDGGTGICGELFLYDFAKASVTGGTGGSVNVKYNNYQSYSAGNGGIGLEGKIGAINSLVHFTAAGGEGGTSYYYSDGVSGRATRLEEPPVLSAGYVNANFYGTRPVNETGDPVFKAELALLVDHEPLANALVAIKGDNMPDYRAHTDSDGMLYAYLPQGTNYTVVHDRYSAELPFLWDNDTNQAALELTPGGGVSDPPYRILGLKLKDQTGAILSSVPETGTFLAELEAEKLNDSKNKEYFIIAVYDENGVLLNLSYMWGAVQTGKTSSFGCSVSIPAGRHAKSVRAFIWDENMNPLCENVVI